MWMLAYNRFRNTFQNRVNYYIALTEFAKSRLIAGGLPAERIGVKPNFLPEPLNQEEWRELRGFCRTSQRRKGVEHTSFRMEDG
jgi:hypothetical protein